MTDAEQMVRFHEYLIDIKTLPLRKDAGWTTHFVIYRDSRSSIDLVKKVELGNISATVDEAYRLGLDESKRIILEF